MHALKYRTRGQSENPLRKEHRYGRITASQFGKIVTRVSFAGPLVWPFLYGGDVPSLSALAYGNMYEQDGIDAV